MVVHISSFFLWTREKDRTITSKKLNRVAERTRVREDDVEDLHILAGKVSSTYSYRKQMVEQTHTHTP